MTQARESCGIEAERAKGNGLEELKTTNHTLLIEPLVFGFSVNPIFTIVKV